MNRIEAAISSALIHWVKETYPEIIITATANEKSYKETRQIGSLGIPDLILFDLRDGRVLFLELKKKKGKLLPSQITWNAKFDTCHPPNFSRAVAYGFLEAKRIIKDVIGVSAPTTPLIS